MPIVGILFPFCLVMIQLGYAFSAQIPLQSHEIRRKEEWAKMEAERLAARDCMGWPRRHAGRSPKTRWSPIWEGLGGRHIHARWLPTIRSGINPPTPEGGGGVGSDPPRFFWNNFFYSCAPPVSSVLSTQLKLILRVLRIRRCLGKQAEFL